MRIEQFISDHLRELLAVRRVLTIFDPERRLLEVARSLAGEKCKLIEVSDDIITAREMALESFAELPADASSTSAVIIYIPRPRPLDAEAICLDPFTPFVLAGGVFPDGAGDSYQSLCQRFLPEQTGMLQEMFQSGEPTFADVNSLVAGTQGAPVLSGLLQAEGTSDLFVRFLCLKPAEAKKLKASPHWRKELQTVVSKTLGLDLPENVSDLAELRRVLWRFLLFSEFAADLPVPLPTALTAVPRAAPRYQRFVFDLCAALRDRASAQQSYEEYANVVSEELGLETHCQALEDLGVLDTFAFEERCFLRNFAKMALSDQLEKASQFVSERSKSFWIRDSERAGEWKLAACCVEVLQSTADLDRVVKERNPASAAAWMDFYTSYGYRLDTAHRLMEQVAQELVPGTNPLADVLSKARSVHRRLVDRITRSFQDCVGSTGWPVSGYARATDVFERYVRMPWQEGKRVALFWIDAFRYELGKLLESSLSARHAVSVSAICAQLPTVTNIGMAALLPGANDDFRVLVRGKDVVPEIKGRVLAGSSHRLEYMKEIVGANRFAAVELSDLISAKDFSALEHAEVLLIKSAEIDQLGESNPAYLLGLLPGRMRDLQTAINRLADAGFGVAIVATDHGFCWFDTAATGDAIAKPADGEWVQIKERCLLGAGQPNAQVLCLETGHVGIRSDIPRYVAARGMATFTKGIRFFHEGLSLQECVLPVVQVALKASPKKTSGGRIDLLLTYRGGKTGTVTTLRPSVEVSVPSGDLFVPMDVAFVLEGFDEQGNRVAEAAPSPAADPATREVRMQKGQSIKVPIRIEESFNGKFELRAAHPQTGEIFATIKLTTNFHH